MGYSAKDLARFAQITDINFDTDNNNFKPDLLLIKSITGNSYITIFDFTKINFIYFSPAVTSTLGYNPDFLINKGLDYFFSLIHPDDLLRHRVIHQEMLATFSSLSNTEKLKCRYSTDYRVKRIDNQYIRLLDQHNCISIDDKGRPLLDLIVSTDISAYKTDNRMIFTITKFNEKKKTFTETHHNYLSEFKNGILTKREIEVLDYLNMGLINKEISEKMNISIDTIKTHRKNIKKKIKQSLKKFIF
jgi:predicted DNA-binding protein (UPF0251 family)